MKMDKDLYKKTKETGEKAGNKSIEINLNQTESTTENTTTSAQIEKTEISDLFSGDLEDAKRFWVMKPRLKRIWILTQGTLSATL